jgi:hypothetical protein
MQRSTHDVKASQTAIGHIWSQLGPAHVDFAGFRNSFHTCPLPAPPLTPVLGGNITIYKARSDHSYVQVEGPCTRSTDGGQSASLNKHISLKTVHGHDASVGGLVLPLLDMVKDAEGKSELNQSVPSVSLVTDRAIG